MCRAQRRSQQSLDNSRHYYGQPLHEVITVTTELVGRLVSESYGPTTLAVYIRSLLPLTLALLPMSPLKINAQTGEPYLQLPAPHTNIIVTPPRRSDASAIVNILGDQQLSLLLRRPPHPYLPKHAEEWLDQVTAWSDSARRELEKVGCEGTLSSCPVRSIREVKADGSDVYLGDIELRKSLFDSVTDEVERKLLRDENEAREKGDARIIWEIGCEPWDFSLNVDAQARGASRLHHPIPSIPRHCDFGMPGVATVGRGKNGDPRRKSRSART